MVERKPRGLAGDKTICLPMDEKRDYEALVKDTTGFWVYLDEQIQQHPELFPSGIEAGYCFHGFVESGRLGLRPDGFA
jgi:hypothetical protein